MDLELPTGEWFYLTYSLGHSTILQYFLKALWILYHFAYSFSSGGYLVHSPNYSSWFKTLLNLETNSGLVTKMDFTL